MPNLSSIPDFDEVSAFIKEKVEVMRAPARQWADIARQAVQGLPHDARRLAELEARINALRAELRNVVLAASEHFSEEQLHTLRKKAGMSKYAWRTLQTRRTVNTKNGFSLVIY
jgi:hypothetical protein